MCILEFYKYILYLNAFILVYHQLKKITQFYS
jgi:hypothetical protein